MPGFGRASSVLNFRLPNLFQHGQQGGFVGDQAAEFGQFPGIVGFGEPEFQVAAFSVFLGQVLGGAGEMAGFVKFGIVLEAELEGPQEDGVRIDLPVGFGYDAAIEGTRGLFG